MTFLSQKFFQEGQGGWVEAKQRGEVTGLYGNLPKVFIWSSENLGLGNPNKLFQNLMFRLQTSCQSSFGLRPWKALLVAN